MAVTPVSLFSLIDAYAAAAVECDEAYRELAAWAFADAREQMLTARTAVADALGIPADALPELDAAHGGAL